MTCRTEVLLLSSLFIIFWFPAKQNCGSPSKRKEGNKPRLWVTLVPGPSLPHCVSWFARSQRSPPPGKDSLLLLLILAQAAGVCAHVNWSFWRATKKRPPLASQMIDCQKRSRLANHFTIFGGERLEPPWSEQGGKESKDFKRPWFGLRGVFFCDGVSHRHRRQQKPIWNLAVRTISN